MLVAGTTNHALRTITWEPQPSSWGDLSTAFFFLVCCYHWVRRNIGTCRHTYKNVFSQKEKEQHHQAMSGPDLMALYHGHESVRLDRDRMFELGVTNAEEADVILGILKEMGLLTVGNIRGFTKDTMTLFLEKCHIVDAERKQKDPTKLPIAYNFETLVHSFVPTYKAVLNAKLNRANAFSATTFSV